MGKSATLQKQNNIATIIIYILLLGSLATVTLPFVAVKVPPVGSKTLSVQDIIKVIPKAVTPKEKKKSKIGFKFDYDYVDVLMKVLPKNEKTNEPVKLSLPFILGILVPITLALTYALVLLGFLLAPFRKGLLGGSSALAICTSAYTIGGVFYIGLSAQRAFQDAVATASEGRLGSITKNFIPEITIEPESGLYTLLGLMLAVFAVNVFRSSKQ